MTRTIRLATLLTLAACASGAPAAPDAPDGSGDAVPRPGPLPLHAPVTLDFEGPRLAEAPATFLDHRLQVVFTHEASGAAYDVPGYFAADGNAAETGADAGRVWRVRFTPDAPGDWRWRASFRTGPNVAISASAGAPLAPIDGQAGHLRVAEAPRAGAGFPGGRLVHPGGHYLRAVGTDEVWLKTGAGSPENVFAYEGFDGTRDLGGTVFPALGENQLHAFAPHAGDWRAGDPDWRDGEGRALIGAFNYLASVGVNAQYLVLMNVEGDGQDVWPWADPAEPRVFDVSKLDQWGIVFDHMDALGIMRDVILTETENEGWFEAIEGGAPFADIRRLYYRELIARFGHGLGITWNLGEENGIAGETGEEPWRLPASPKTREAFAQAIRALDPYDHPIVLHGYPDTEDFTYAPHLGPDSALDGISLQAHSDYAGKIRRWRERSAAAGKAWMIHIDEPLGWEFGARPDEESPGRDLERQTVLWPGLLSGGGGGLWYFGWQNNAPISDLSNEDMRTRDALWRQSRVARTFMARFDLAAMTPQPGRTPRDDDAVLGGPDGPFVLFQPDEAGGAFDLTGLPGPWTVAWFDPKDGGPLAAGSVAAVGGGAMSDLGTPPAREGAHTDWVIVLSR